MCICTGAFEAITDHKFVFDEKKESQNANILEYIFKLVEKKQEEMKATIGVYNYVVMRYTAV